MNKQDLIGALAEKTTLTKAQIRHVVDETFDYISTTISTGKKFQIMGFGSFQVKRRAQRIGVNPRTGEKISIDSKNVPVFVPGKKLIDSVNGGLDK